MLGVQKALDHLQAKQCLLKKQLIFYWIELQLLHRQGALCSQTHQALTRGGRDVAEAILHLTQYYGMCSADRTILFSLLVLGRFPTPAQQGKD